MPRDPRPIKHIALMVTLYKNDERKKFVEVPDHDSAEEIGQALHRCFGEHIRGVSFEVTYEE